ncbi:MAG: hypothetical protein WB870_07165, partial [Gallionellaceae bacterium]
SPKAAMITGMPCHRTFQAIMGISATNRQSPREIDKILLILEKIFDHSDHRKKPTVEARD